METTTIQERLRLFIQEKSLTRNGLATKLSVPQMTIQNYFDNRDPSFSFLVRLLAFFPELSAEWLMMGRGEMYKKDEKAGNAVSVGTMTGGNAVAGGNVNVAADYERMLKEKDERIAELKSDKDQLKLLVEMLTRK